MKQDSPARLLRLILEETSLTNRCQALLLRFLTHADRNRFELRNAPCMSPSTFLSLQKLQDPIAQCLRCLRYYDGMSPCSHTSKNFCMITKKSTEFSENLKISLYNVLKMFLCDDLIDLVFHFCVFPWYENDYIQLPPSTLQPFHYLVTVNMAWNLTQAQTVRLSIPICSKCFSTTLHISAEQTTKHKEGMKVRYWCQTCDHVWIVA